MPPPEGLKTCPTCGLPYQIGRKANHDLKASHRAAVTPPSSSRTVTRRVTVEGGAPTETFGQRMARLKLEKKAAAEQATAPANPDADAAQAEQQAAQGAKPTRAQRAAAKVDAERASGERPDPDER